MTRESIWIVGSSRSGTSMMGALLGLHSQVFGTPELHFFEHHTTAADRRAVLDHDAQIELATRLFHFLRHGGVGGGDVASYSSEAAELVQRLHGRPVTAPTLFEEYLYELCARHGKQIPCEQTPRNVFYLREILDTYPGARVVNMIRDPRDVLASQKHKWKLRLKGLKQLPVKEALRLRVNYHPITTSLLWRAAIRAGDRFAGDERVIQLRFEDVLADPDGEIDRLCAFLGLDFEPAMLQVPQVKSTFEAWGGERRGINPDAAGRWQRGALDPAEIYLCQRICRPEMARHRYDVVDSRPGPAVAYGVASFPVKASIAFIANMGRNRSSLEALRRRFARQT